MVKSISDISFVYERLDMTLYSKYILKLVQLYFMHLKACKYFKPQTGMSLPLAQHDSICEGLYKLPYLPLHNSNALKHTEI